MELLEVLRRGGGFVSMEALRREVGRPAGEIRREIERLREAGHVIEAEPARGYRLGQAAGLTAELIEAGLGTGRIGRRVLVYRSTESTNDVAWQHAGAAGYDGLAVFAEEQRLGRGRLGRNWQAPAGSSLLVSVLLEGVALSQAAQLSLLAGLATAEAIERTCGLSGRIKWPNDVIFDGRKAAGVMVEARPMADGGFWKSPPSKGGGDHPVRRERKSPKEIPLFPEGASKVVSSWTYVIGIGINCNQAAGDFPAEIQQTAVSMRMLTGAQVDRVGLGQELLRRLEHWIRADGPGPAALHDAWRGRCDDIGRRITLVCDGKTFRGRALDIDPGEGLLVQLDHGGVKVFDAATTTVQR